MLTAMTMMMMFKDGNIDDIFLYGANRAFMTVFGIVVYTLVGILLWPVAFEDRRSATAKDVTEHALQLLLTETKEEHKETLKALLPVEQALRLTTESRNDTTSQMGLTRRQWNAIVEDYLRSDALLYILSEQTIAFDDAALRRAVPNYGEARAQAETLYRQIAALWERRTFVDIPATWKAAFDRDALAQMKHLDRAAAIQIARTTERLLRRLVRLAEKLNAMVAPQPTSFAVEALRASPRFLWFDPEDLKGAAVSFLAFWTGVGLWIVLNTPQGFTVAAVATSLSLLTTYSVARPALLIVLFSISFVFAAAAYIFVLPQMHTGTQLAVFLFVYAFIGFYFLSQELSVFFLMGLMTLYITNSMIFNFNLFMLILLIFYLFLFILLFLEYVPFTMKPEKLTLMLQRRFFALCAALLSDIGEQVHARRGRFFRMPIPFVAAHMIATVKKMRFWAERIDTGYFSSVDKTALLEFVDACEALGYHLRIYREELLRVRDNPFVRDALERKTDAFSLEKAFRRLLQTADAQLPDAAGMREAAETFLTGVLAKREFDGDQEKQLADFYEIVNLNTTAWNKTMQVVRLKNTVDFNALKASRF